MITNTKYHSIGITTLTCVFYKNNIIRIYTSTFLEIFIYDTPTCRTWINERHQIIRIYEFQSREVLSAKIEIILTNTHKLIERSFKFHINKFTVENSKLN